MWQCHWDNKRKKWIITLDGHEIWAVKRKKDAVRICKHETAEQKNQTVHAPQTGG